MVISLLAFSNCAVKGYKMGVKIDENKNYAKRKNSKHFNHIKPGDSLEIITTGNIKILGTYIKLEKDKNQLHYQSVKGPTSILFTDLKSLKFQNQTHHRWTLFRVGLTVDLVITGLASILGLLIFIVAT